ncbi:MAG: ABC transporter ATP-binding protein [Lachnospiraceae bacterium]|nr:ABC transporter ATP-binding protein [Lachnospiraceae bacterium]
MDASTVNNEKISVRNVDFSYRKHHVLDHLEFDLPLGESIAVLGANGSGKSTLLSILSGVRRCHGASMEYRGHDLTRDKKLRNRLIAYVPQTDPLLPELSVWDNLLLWFHGPASGLKEALTLPSVEMLRIDEFIKKPVRALSGGMRKRVSLATALINDPQILIMDEPAAALDLCYKAEIREFLSRFHQSGKTLILTTHDEEDLSIITLLYLLKDGHLYRSPRVLRGDELVSVIRGDIDISRIMTGAPANAGDAFPTGGSDVS